eukprot:CAMPEP_0195290162 /NCGR_PEP_ID=MMETSP0707-20130614/6136_1 /TAXON_ID=33640 /ORGANISM="Asterionellopsis glacialis, Strain CCMP134" /LENGTH=476 /DNA_ID=CAMNT_0040350251 /DNA_START=18 /DNA_END=1448 /DNA_ORIENTATION=-
MSNNTEPSTTIKCRLAAVVREEIPPNETNAMRSDGERLNKRPNEGAGNEPVGWRERLQRRAPRSYNFIFRVVLPVFCIIPFCILCGFVLVKIEAPNEIDSNNAAIADYAARMKGLERINSTTWENLNRCYDLFDAPGDEMVNATDFLREYRAHALACEATAKKANQPILESFYFYFLGSITASVSFDWTRCAEEGESIKPRPFLVQFTSFYNAWLGDFRKLDEEYNISYGDALPDGMDTQDLAIQDAEGTKNCELNVAGGSIFWWTIMTTVGYGNTAPSTRGGRLLVYTLGFLSIIAFAAILGSAGHIMLTICDDFFLRVRLKRLVDGFLSALFWLSAMLLWFFIVAAIYKVIYEERYPVKEGITLQFNDGQSYPYKSPPISFSDGFWFSFITGTTVGLGDLYIAHETYSVRDMFYVPLLFLVSFLFFSNFAIKLAGIMSPFGVGEDLHGILEERRLVLDVDVAEEDETDAFGPPS